MTKSPSPARDQSCDVFIANGQLVYSDRVEAGGIAIRDGRISAIVGPGETFVARERIDAKGKLVLPGFVDAHAHLREPGLTHKEDFVSGTRAAAAGGVTTVMVMPTDDPWTVTPEEFVQKRALAEGKSYVDFALQAAIGPAIGDVDALVQLGAISFELFLVGGRADFLVEQDRDLHGILSRMARSNVVTGITAGSPGIVAALVDAQKKSGRNGTDAFAATRPPFAEALGVARACLMARETKARVHFRQISCKAAVDVLESMRRGELISAEVTPHNLVLTDQDARDLGPFGAVIPPLRPADEKAALTDALRRGVLDIVATDHAPHLPAEKEKGLPDIWRAPPGLPGLQTFCLAMLSLADCQLLTLPQIVWSCAELPAKRFGLYPKKGALVEGADADLIIVDPRISTEIADRDQYSKSAYSPFRGRKVNARIESVFLRGELVARDGKVAGAARGEFLRPTPSTQ